MSIATRLRSRKYLYGAKINSKLMLAFKSYDFSKLKGISDESLIQLGLDILGTDSPDADQLKAPSGFAVVYGCNNPRPPRVTKRILDTNQSSLTTYCSYNKLAGLTRSGWSIASYGSEPAIRKANAQGRTLTAFVEISKVFYGFSMNKKDFNDFKDQLGLKGAEDITSATELARVAMGCSKPRPPKVSKTFPSALGKKYTVTSWAAPDKVSDLRKDEWAVLSNYVPTGS